MPKRVQAAPLRRARSTGAAKGKPISTSLPLMGAPIVWPRGIPSSSGPSPAALAKDDAWRRPGWRGRSTVSLRAGAACSGPPAGVDGHRG